MYKAIQQSDKSLSRISEFFPNLLDGHFPSGMADPFHFGLAVFCTSEARPKAKMEHSEGTVGSRLW